MNRDSSLQHTRKVGDRLSPICRTLVQGGTVVDLTGKTVLFKAIDSRTGVVKIDDASASVVAPATAGKVQYTFQATDVDTAGIYHAWFKVSSGGVVDTFPADGFITLIIQDLT